MTALRWSFFGQIPETGIRGRRDFARGPGRVFAGVYVLSIPQLLDQAGHHAPNWFMHGEASFHSDSFGLCFPFSLHRRVVDA
jgi:hypothetical protein